MNITTILNRLQKIADKHTSGELLSRKDLEYIEENINKAIFEMETDLNFLFDLKDNVSLDYTLKLKS
jgi:hypothetical protein